MRVFFRDDQLFFLEYKLERIVNSEEGAKEAQEQQSILSIHKIGHYGNHHINIYIFITMGIENGDSKSQNWHKYL